MTSRIPFLLILLVLGVCTLLFSAALGTVPIPISRVLHDLIHPGLARDQAMDQILLYIRVPRVFLAFLVGGALAVAGTGLQGSLRNPLADPYIVGTSSGAALGVAVSFLLGWDKLGLVPVVAFAGALLSNLAVLILARRAGKLPVTTVLLAGVVTGSFVWALVTFLLTLNGQNIGRVVFWLMGSLSDRSWEEVHLMFPYTLAGLAVLWACAYPLNLLTLGEERAQSLGTNPEKIKLVVLLASSLLTGAAVSSAGLVGFVGLMVPHGIRSLGGPDHRGLIPASFLAGGSLLVWADTLSRLLFQPAELPVGVVTALLGAPFFLYLLRRVPH